MRTFHLEEQDSTQSSFKLFEWDLCDHCVATPSVWPPLGKLQPRHLPPLTQRPMHQLWKFTTSYSPVKYEERLHTLGPRPLFISMNSCMHCLQLSHSGLYVKDHCSLIVCESIHTGKLLEAEPSCWEQRGNATYDPRKGMICQIKALEITDTLGTWDARVRTSSSSEIG